MPSSISLISFTVARLTQKENIHIPLKLCGIKFAYAAFFTFQFGVEPAMAAQMDYWLTAICANQRHGMLTTHGDWA